MQWNVDCLTYYHLPESWPFALLLQPCRLFLVHTWSKFFLFLYFYLFFFFSVPK